MKAKYCHGYYSASQPMASSAGTLAAVQKAGGVANPAEQLGNNG